MIGDIMKHGSIVILCIYDKYSEPNNNEDIMNNYDHKFVIKNIIGVANDY